MSAEERANGPLPGVNARVTLKLESTDAEFFSRIEETPDDGFVVAAPVGVSPAASPAAGDTVLIGWGTPGGWNQLPVRIRDVTGQGDAAFRTDVAGPVERLQRRDFARAPESGLAEVIAGERLLPGRLLDLSEGGLRCAIASDTPMRQGEEVEVSFIIEGASVGTLASVVRLHRRPRNITELSLSFVGLGVGDAERIRRHVSARQALIQSRKYT